MSPLLISVELPPHSTAVQSSSKAAGPGGEGGHFSLQRSLSLSLSEQYCGFPLSWNILFSVLVI